MSKTTVSLSKITEDEHITDIVQLLTAGRNVTMLIDTDAVAPGKIARMSQRVKQRVAGTTVTVVANTARVSKVTFATP